MNALVKSQRSLLLQPTRSAGRRLFLEGLENRTVLAGDVWVAQFGGNLMIQGDGDANGVHIQNMIDGTVEVSGLDAGGAPTTINGGEGAFVASNVRFLTRVHLGSGNDTLQIDYESNASAEAGDSTTANNTSSTNATSDAGNSFRGRLNGLLNGAGRELFNNLFDRIGGIASRQHLIINTGAGSDTVDAMVDADVEVHLAGSIRGDTISIQPLSEDSPDSGMATTAAIAATDGVLNANAEAEVDTAVEAGLNAAPNADAGLSANVNAALDAVGNLTTGGISTNADLDSALIANLALNSALNSASNLGINSLLNGDRNLNGSIGGAAALNLAGDGLFDEFGLFNQASLANMNADIATSLALANANSFALNNNAVDDFFASMDDQLDASADAAIDANLDSGLLATLGNNDLVARGSLNTNINTNLNNAFQSRLGAVPLG